MKLKREADRSKTKRTRRRKKKIMGRQANQLRRLISNHHSLPRLLLSLLLLLMLEPQRALKERTCLVLLFHPSHLLLWLSPPWASSQFLRHRFASLSAFRCVGRSASRCFLLPLSLLLLPLLYRAHLCCLASAAVPLSYDNNNRHLLPN